MHNQQKIDKIDFDVAAALADMGYVVKDFGDHLRAAALYREGTSDNSMVIYKDSGVWNDYGADMYGQPFSKLVELTSGDKTFDASSFSKNENRFNRVERNEDASFKYQPSVLEKLLPHHKFYEDKGIKASTIRCFRGGLATEGKMYQRYVFPIFNGEGEIIGFSGRNISPSSGGRAKWKHLGRKTEWLFPYYIEKDGKLVTQEAIEKTREVHLIESVGDTLSFFDNGEYNCLCAFGISVSSLIVSSLVACDPDYIFISFNNDSTKSSNSGLIGSIKVYAKLLEFFEKDRVKICLPVKNDFGDMSHSDFEAWREKKEKIKREDIFPKVFELTKKLYEEGREKKSAMKIPLSTVKAIKKYE